LYLGDGLRRIVNDVVECGWFTVDQNYGLVGALAIFTCDLIDQLANVVHAICGDVLFPESALWRKVEQWPVAKHDDRRN
jgi:hypothetical protein